MFEIEANTVIKYCNFARRKIKKHQFTIMCSIPLCKKAKCDSNDAKIKVYYQLQKQVNELPVAIAIMTLSAMLLLFCFSCSLHAVFKASFNPRRPPGIPISFKFSSIAWNEIKFVELRINILHNNLYSPPHPLLYRKISLFSPWIPTLNKDKKRWSTMIIGENFETFILIMH